MTPLEAKGIADMAVAEDGLCHFRWASRPSQDVELDLILVRGRLARHCRQFFRLFLFFSFFLSFSVSGDHLT